MYLARISSVVVLVALASVGVAQPGATPVSADPAGQLMSAMRSRVSVSQDRHTGKTIPATHCRHAVGGCDKRLGEFARYIVDVGQEHGIDPWLMAAMAFKESGFNPYAIGSLGELGILQINPERRDAKEVRFMRDQWYRQRCRKEPGNCQREVVEHAARVLGRSLELCGDVKDALGAYNTGRCGGNDRYAKRVLAERGELRRAAGLYPELAARPGRPSRT